MPDDKKCPRCYGQKWTLRKGWWGITEMIPCGLCNVEMVDATIKAKRKKFERLEAEMWK